MCVLPVDAGPASLAVGDAEVDVAEGKTGNIFFKVTRSGETGDSAIVQFRTQDGTATAGTDYTETVGTLIIPAGGSSGRVKVPVIGQAPAGSTKHLTMQLQRSVGSAASPSFGQAFQPDLGGEQFGDFVEGDFNSDGRIDIATAGGVPEGIAVLLNATPLGATTPSFAARQDFPAGSGLRGLATGDLNQDGKLDLAIINVPDDTVSVLLNTTPPGAKKLSFTAPQSFIVGSLPTGIALADVDLSGTLDLITANNFENTVSVRLNFTSTGSLTAFFPSERRFPTADAPFDVVAGDINGDGKPDLVISDNEDKLISVLIDRTRPGVSVADFAGPTNFAASGDIQNGPFELGLADFNGDGRLDVVAANHGLPLLSVFVNATPAGADTPILTKEQTLPLTSIPDQVALGDLNGDGRLDIVAPQDGKLTVLRNDTPPGTPRVDFTALGGATVDGSPRRRIAIADFNGDGKNDLVAASTLAVALNTTKASPASAGFAPAVDFPSNHSGARRIAAGDLTGDGKPDLVTLPNGTPTQIDLLRNLTAPAAPVAAFAKAKSFDVGANATDVNLGDVNLDGRLDIAVSNSNDQTISFLINTATPGATQPRFAAQQTVPSSVTPSSLILGDIDLDGMPDLLVAGPGDRVATRINRTFQREGDSTVTFDDEKTFPVDALLGERSLAFADLNGDGRRDLLVASSADENIAILANQTVPPGIQAKFAPQQRFPSGGSVTQAGGLAVGDINNDGREDIVVTHSGSNSVSVLLNRTRIGSAQFAFTSPRGFSTTTPIGVALADIDGDGLLDILVSNVGATLNNVSLLRNRTQPGSAIASFVPQQSFSCGQNPIALVASDFNGDGKPDVATGNLTSLIPAVSVMLNSQYLVTVGDGQATGTIRIK
ncbi:MAG: FG-GAP-like repeat-containing protein [Methylotetracoccus sp.]